MLICRLILVLPEFPGLKRFRKHAIRILAARRGPSMARNGFQKRFNPGNSGRALIFTVFTVLMVPQLAYAALSSQETLIQSLYHNPERDKTLSMPDRLEKYSRLFLNAPYVLGPLGEGSAGRYDQFPRYRFDAFDCLTFVETVLALAHADNQASFQQMMNRIRYKNGVVSFIARNHFTDLDWNRNNQQHGMLQDITNSIVDQQGRRVAKMAHAEINKPAWYQHLSKNRIRLLDASSSEQEKRLLALKAQGQHLRSENVSIPYLPLMALFDAQGRPCQYLFQQIPHGAIIEIVRPNWDVTQAIGTHMNVSHLGFVFRREGTLMFRNASSIKGQVVDQPLVDYLREAYYQSPTIKGINIQKVVH